MDKRKVLFVCTHNSARSQMAEEYLRKLSGENFEVKSAGLEPGSLNPHVVALLKEDGIDISGKPTVDVFDLFKSGEQFDYVITVCSKEAEARCPIFPGRVVRRNWSFPDPSAFTGSDEAVRAQVVEVRDAIVKNLEEFIAEYQRRHSGDAVAT